MTTGSPAIDFAFLDAQTFGDAALARDVLQLFVAQARRLLPALSDLSFAEQTATAHLLKGSCQGIGATRAADLLHRFGEAGSDARRPLLRDVAAAFAEVECAALDRLADV